MTTTEAINQVAIKYGLGQTLVTGHAAKYWIEAMKLYAEHERNKVLELHDVLCLTNPKYGTKETYAVTNIAKHEGVVRRIELTPHKNGVDELVVDIFKVKQNS